MSPSRLLLPSLFAVALSLFLLGGGCSSPQEPPLCERALEDPEAEEEEEEEEDDAQITFVRPVRPAEWLNLMVNSAVGERAIQECTGNLIRMPDPSDACREAEEEAREANPDEYVEEEPPEPVELSEESVVLGRISSKRKLVWIVTHEFENGDGLGPVALVERHDSEDDGSSLKVRALGALRARRERVRLRLETIPVRSLVVVEGERCLDGNEEEEEEEEQSSSDSGDSDEEEEDECEPGQFLLRSQGVTCRNKNRTDSCTFDRRYVRRMRKFLQCGDSERPETCYIPRQILIAEGETCEDPEVLETCSRSAQYLFRNGTRFQQAELHDINGHCLGSATMLFADHTEIRLGSGWERDFTLSTSFEIVDAGHLLLHEQVVAIDSDPRQPPVPPRPYRTAETDVRWYPFESRFITATPSLWGRMLEEAASMHVPPPEE